MPDHSPTFNRPRLIDEWNALSPVGLSHAQLEDLIAQMREGYLDMLCHPGARVPVELARHCSRVLVEIANLRHKSGLTPAQRERVNALEDLSLRSIACVFYPTEPEAFYADPSAPRYL